jgi:hypothetical protein
VIAVVIAAVVVVAAVLAVVLSGALSPSSGSSVSLVSEQTAAATATHFTEGVSGGPWQLVGASGYLGSGPINVSRLLHSTPTCPVRNGTVTTISTPAFSQPYYQGLTEIWILLYVNSGFTSALTVLVQNGAVAELGQWSASGCGIASLTPLGTGLIDSTAAAQAVTTTAVGSAFIVDHPHANATYELLYTSYAAGGTSKNASLWYVLFDATDWQLGAEVFANNGTVLCTSGARPPCSQPSMGVPIGTAFSAANPVSSLCPAGDTYLMNGCAAGDYTYTLMIEVSTVTFASVLFEVKTSAGAILTLLAGTGGFSILNVTQGVAAQAAPSAAAMVMTSPFESYGTSYGPTSPLTTLDRIFIDMGTGNPLGLGYTFIVIGAGQYTGTTSPLTLP